MNATLLKEAEKIKIKARERKIDFMCSFTSDNKGMIFGHKEGGKAILIGVKENYWHDQVRAFSIDVNKWIWAIKVGFETEDIIGKLFDEIFKEIPLKSAANYL